MSEQVWDRYLTERDKQVFASGGFGAPKVIRTSTTLVLMLNLKLRAICVIKAKSLRIILMQILIY